MGETHHPFSESFRLVSRRRQGTRSRLMEVVDPSIRQWYQALMQPDVPNASCCGEADACQACDNEDYLTVNER